MLTHGRGYRTYALVGLGLVLTFTYALGLVERTVWEIGMGWIVLLTKATLRAALPPPPPET